MLLTAAATLLLATAPAWLVHAAPGAPSSFVDACYSCTIDSHFILSCTCKTKGDAAHIPATLDLSDCISNDNGKLGFSEE